MTLTERKTRYELILLLNSKDSKFVNDSLSKLRDIFSTNIDKIFKTVTSDNGVEFSNLGDAFKKCGTDVYYTHPYSAWERGTNERHKGLYDVSFRKGKR